METQNCVVCGRKNTKYSCITCSRKICNVCSQSCLPSEIGYSEENHTIGKCGDCVNEAVELFEEEEVMVSKQKTTFKKKDGRQLKLDFFTKKTGANDGNSAASGENRKKKRRTVAYQTIKNLFSKLLRAMLSIRIRKRTLPPQEV